MDNPYNSSNVSGVGGGTPTPTAENNFQVANSALQWVIKTLAEVRTLLGGALTAMSAVGDFIIGGAAGAATRLPGNTTTTRKFLRQVGDGAGAVLSTAWDTVTLADLGLTAPLQLKGAIDCSGNPNYPAAAAGEFYTISVAGRIGGASGTVVTLWDQALCITTTVAGTQAAVGACWVVGQGNVDLTNIAITGGTITGTTVGGLTPVAQAVGFTLAGGTTPATLTIVESLEFTGIIADTTLSGTPVIGCWKDKNGATYFGKLYPTKV